MSDSVLFFLTVAVKLLPVWLYLIAFIWLYFGLFGETDE